MKERQMWSPLLLWKSISLVLLVCVFLSILIWKSTQGEGLCCYTWPLFHSHFPHGKSKISGLKWSLKKEALTGTTKPQNWNILYSSVCDCHSLYLDKNLTWKEELWSFCSHCWQRVWPWETFLFALLSVSLKCSWPNFGPAYCCQLG